MNTVNKLLRAYSHNTILHYDKWSEKHAYRALNDGNLKQWISNILPSELLERSLKKADAQQGGFGHSHRAVHR